MFLSRQLCSRMLVKNTRYYATSRFPKKLSGVGRSRSTRDIPRNTARPARQQEAGSPLITEHQLYRLDLSDTRSGSSKPLNSVDIGLKRLLIQSDTLIIERQIEMLNVFVGYEQANKYTITNDTGEVLGYIAEEPKGFLGTISRQIRRPFAWINSRMFVERLKENNESLLETFGEVQQIWHPWRRRYDLFLRENLPGGLVSLTNSQRQSDESTYYQIGKVDSGFLAWKFHILNQHGDVISTVDRAFRGLGRELFTDTGKYSIHFKPSSLNFESQIPEVMEDATRSSFPVISQELDIDTRALLLALAVNIDFDYFSRHSHSGGGGLFHMTDWD